MCPTCSITNLKAGGVVADCSVRCCPQASLRSSQHRSACNVTAHTGVAATLFARRQTCLPSLRISVWSRPLLSMILFHSIALRPVHYISCCIFVASEPSFLASCLSFSIYWLFEFPMSTFIVQHNFDWKPIKWTAFSDSSKMFAMYNCRLILVETASGFAVGLALVQRLICGLKYIAVRLGPVGEGRTRA